MCYFTHLAKRSKQGRGLNSFNTSKGYVVFNVTGNFFLSLMTPQMTTFPLMMLILSTSEEWGGAEGRSALKTNLFFWEGSSRMDQLSNLANHIPVSGDREQDGVNRSRRESMLLPATVLLWCSTHLCGGGSSLMGSAAIPHFYRPSYGVGFAAF